ncbi:hypothetical protein F4778DRAFT_702935 [Xylariomycetidae sp. FL2044]|nr:hypothetical protein F4778DRAFT_702935 [Xylariomycetidae sp. FL2044]
MLAHRLYNTLILPAFGSLILIPAAFGQDDAGGRISGTSLDGTTRQLALDRTPALYSGNFGDCLGGESLLNVTKFDTGLYYDNSTVLFHLDGTSSIRRDDVMLYISIDAYGETGFNMTVDPCAMNIPSLCPLQASQPVEASAAFNVTQEQVSDIPSIAYHIPDYDGFARVQIFSNSSQSEIACFQAVMRNGHSFSQPASISTVLGVFTVVAIVSSFVTAAYGVSIPHMRTHYAHSLSVLVIFEVFQSIFYTGALSLEWPSVLPAWWSNFAWSAGMIPIAKLVHSIDPFVGVSGNASQVGAAGSTIINNNGGLANQIYGRSLVADSASGLAQRSPDVLDGVVDIVAKRQASELYDYHWSGVPVKPGMPLPGDWSNFAGELSALNIPAANAFMVGFIWFLVLVGLVVLFVVTFKLVLEFLVKIKYVKSDGLAYFRSHWMGFLSLALLRTMLIAFFSMTTLATYEFAVRGNPGPTALAAVILAIFLLGLGISIFYALQLRLRSGAFASDPDRILFQRGRVMKFIPWIIPVRSSQLRERETGEKPAGSLPFVRWHFVDHDTERQNVHQDEPYVKRFGWLPARYRLSRWWFFAFWFVYQLFRAGFLGGASSRPLVQVFGVFILDILALFIIAALSPFEGERNTALAVWLLGLAKVITTGLSVAFLPDFNLDRIVTTVIGLVIIVIQSFLTIAVMILIIIGAISSWMSLSRNHEYFTSKRLEGVRIRYFEHIEQKASDRPPVAMSSPPSPPRSPDARRSTTTAGASRPGTTTEAFPDLPRESYFSVNAVRRALKIEDEDDDDDFIAEMHTAVTPGAGAVAVAATASGAAAGPRPRISRTASTSSRHSVSSLPRAARAVHRASWSSRDFAMSPPDLERPSPALVRRLSTGPGRDGTASPANANESALRARASAASIGTSGVVGSRPATAAAVTREEGVEEEEEEEENEPEREVRPDPEPAPEPEPRADETRVSEEHDEDRADGKKEDKGKEKVEVEEEEKVEETR